MGVYIYMLFVCLCVLTHNVTGVYDSVPQYSTVVFPVQVYPSRAHQNGGTTAQALHVFNQSSYFFIGANKSFKEKKV